jgi:hypothetical protein
MPGGRDVMAEMPARIQARRTPTAGRIATWVAIIFGVIAGTLLAGVGAAAALAQQGGPDEWHTWSDVGQTFGVLSSIISSLALVAVVITARQNREELERHRQFLMHNNAELKRTSYSSLGMLHQNLVKMSIDDDDLAQVWPAFDPSITPERNRQFLYANLIYSFQLTALQSGNHTETSVIETMRYLFSNPQMRDYWRFARKARTTLDPASFEYEFTLKVDRICAEYERVAANYLHTQGTTRATPLHEHTHTTHAA